MKKKIKILTALYISVLMVVCVSNTATSQTYYIGKNYEGGIIFYIDGTGQHGLIVAPSDQGTYVNWNVADSICQNLVLNGYSDWFLPSKDQLNLLNQQKVLIGGFANVIYWSSTEFSTGLKWVQNFSCDNQYAFIQEHATYVRAIRAF